MPAGIFCIDLHRLQTHFVAESAQRAEIFAAFTQYLATLRTVLADSPFTIWVDGSFVSSKAEPKDIDFVVFIPEINFRAQELILLPFIGKKAYCDAYIVPDTAQLRAQWQSDFSSVFKRVRFDKTQLSSTKKLPHIKKGFIELIF